MYDGIDMQRQRDEERPSSCTEAVERAARALERVHDVEGGDGLALRVFGVGDRVADDLKGKVSGWTKTSRLQWHVRSQGRS
jgi:hypothetical protein